jgi:hypothetical protein
MDIAEMQQQESQLPQTPMPAFISHKRVWALKIAKVHVDEDGQGIAIAFENPSFALRAFTRSQLEHKPIPEPGMYFVQYEGGYFSFSPADAFEKGYSPAEEEPVVEKITLIPGKVVLTPWGELKTVRIVQETKWGVCGELQLTNPQALALAEQIQHRLER